MSSSIFYRSENNGGDPSVPDHGQSSLRSNLGEAFDMGPSMFYHEGRGGGEARLSGSGGTGSHGGHEGVRHDYLPMIPYRRLNEWYDFHRVCRAVQGGLSDVRGDVVDVVVLSLSSLVTAFSHWKRIDLVQIGSIHGLKVGARLPLWRLRKSLIEHFGHTSMSAREGVDWLRRTGGVMLRFLAIVVKESTCKQIM
ncbi:hypothetical protein BV25DRAFT_1837415 [Artomyces pyxidatus]|uniref:Uncharacterized protein n=1 Tax=Artomyces pyxidatus TaxID=48021 RepID=A0ACB8T592_9AGAM|nr:hypothetical protein BV25DRAFT_1837415 [Artomyces pyxidatus]